MKYKLVCFDMDGVIFQHQNFWKELHIEMGTWYEGKILNDRYLKTDYKKLVNIVVKGLWYKKSAVSYYRLVEKAKYNKNAYELIDNLKEKGVKTIIITSGPYDLAERARKELEIDFIEANRLIIENGIIKDMVWPIGNDNKIEFLKMICDRENINLKEVIAIGDDQNDITLFKEVGFSIAFNSSDDDLKKSASVVVASDNLLDLLKYVK